MAPSALQLESGSEASPASGFVGRPRSHSVSPAPAPAEAPAEEDTPDPGGSAGREAGSGPPRRGSPLFFAIDTPRADGTASPSARPARRQRVPLAPGLVTRASEGSDGEGSDGERPLPTTPESRARGGRFSLSSRSLAELAKLEAEGDQGPEEPRRRRRSSGGGSQRTSLGSRQEEALPEGPERRLAGKAVEVHGHDGCRPEINGVYATVRETWSGRTAYRNRTSQVYMIWMWQPPRWKIVPSLGSAETLAFADCSGNEAALPFEAPGPWFVVGRSPDGLPEEIADERVACSFRGQTVVVSGRSGHNQRLNGIYEELAEAYGSFPAYADRQKHLFIYRRQNSAHWVISNRLGPPLCSGRGVVFAEVEDEAPQPYLVRRPWTVHAWSGHPTEQDPNISVFLRAETFKDGPPPAVLTVRSRLHPQTEGTYTMQSGQLVNECVVYARSPQGPGAVGKFLFWDGERWCISGCTADRRRQCDTCSQKREASGHEHPDHAVWPGIEVLPGDAGVIGANLLATLRGRISSLSKNFG